MSLKRLLKIVLGVTHIVVKNFKFEQGSIVVEIRPTKQHSHRCPYCNRKTHLYDFGRGNRRWRALDMGTTLVYLESPAPRINCPKHGVVVASVPWARHGAWFTHAFEEQVAWLCVYSAKTVVSKLMRIDWKSVGSICKRVYDDLDQASGNRFEGLVNIGIDETSYKKGYKYMTLVVNHDTNRVIWCAKGHGGEVLEGFFSLLTCEQKESIEVVSADGARWIATCINKHCPNAVRVMDPFHVVSWATEALDEVRKEAWRRAKVRDKAAAQKRRRSAELGKPMNRRKDNTGTVREARFPLLKNPENLTEQQRLKLEQIAMSDSRLYRAYLLKEGLRSVFKLRDVLNAEQELDNWLSQACRCRIASYVDLSKKIRRHRQAILAAIDSGISNARVEAMNNKIKLTIRQAYGFRNIDNLIALVMLRCSNLPIVLPGRAS